MPKFKPQNRAEKKLHELWLRFLTEINEKTKEIPQEFLDNKELLEAVSYVERGAYTKEQLEAYDKWKIDTMTAASMLIAAEDKGKAEGKAEGEAIGLEKGKAEIAVRLLKKGMTIEDVSDATELPIEQIERLMKKLEVRS